MKKRYTVLGLSLVLALALAVPAFGGPTNPVATASKSVQSIANQALKKAKAAQKTAKAAQSTANSASSTANTANTTANGAKTEAVAANKAAAAAATAAGAAQATANAAKTAAATAQSTAEGKMSGEENIEGEAGTDIGFADCPEGKVPTGGGFIVSGANNNSATVTESTQYLNTWLSAASQISGTSGTTWHITSTVNCAVSP
jgi:trimeric autotransporter adhesin